MDKISNKLRSFCTIISLVVQQMKIFFERMIELVDVTSEVEVYRLEPNMKEILDKLKNLIDKILQPNSVVIKSRI